VNKFKVDWDALKNSNKLKITHWTSILLDDENGNRVRLYNVQGGVISPSGELLYIVADGIHVFDLSTGRRVARSTNGSGIFNYEFDADCTPPFDSECEEPEGLTIWDLDDGRAPGIRGQLHVLLLDNDIADDVYLKHYTGTIHVDRSFIGLPLGTPSHPFPFVTLANNLAWDGARIKIKAGSYPETLTISKRVQVVATGGSVTIGK